MAWHTTFELDEFDAATHAFLLAEPARNTMLLVQHRVGLSGVGMLRLRGVPRFFGRVVMLRFPAVPRLGC